MSGPVDTKSCEETLHNYIVSSYSSAEAALEQWELTELSEGYRELSSKLSPASAAVWIREDYKETSKHYYVK